MTIAQPKQDHGASPAAIRHHYDSPAPFWALWLDPTLTYSCALWGPDDDLEQAQARKLDWMIEGARAQGADRVLDIGCGWGSALRRMVGEHGVRLAVGLTLSAGQKAYADEHGDERCDVRLESWADHVPDKPYDAIVSAGAFEHFSPPRVDRSEKVAIYRSFFAHCSDLLRPGGRMTLQTIAKGDAPLARQALRDFTFICRDVFPQSDLPWPADLVHGSERLFEIVSLRNDRHMYVTTCRAWLERLEARRSEAVAIVGPEIAELYRRYLRACIRQFQGGHAVLVRLVLERVERAPSWSDLIER